MPQEPSALQGRGERAAGIQQNATPNQILTGPATCGEVKDFFITQSVGEMTVKSRQNKVPAYEVL